MKLEPVKTFRLKLGESVMFEKQVEICLARDGKVKIGDKCDNTCVDFNHQGGVGCSWHCFAVRVNGTIKVFQGNSIGSGMITRQQVLAACNLAEA